MASTRAGLVGNDVQGVFFTESMPSPAPAILKAVKIRRNRQNSNLGEIKGLMANEARAIGANAIISFTYGQRSHRWWEQAFTLRWDSESWFGEGLAVHLDGLK